MTSTFARRWGGPALLLLLTAFMAAWTWTRTGDPFLDAAKDLYTAQQMSQGRALYGELCYLFGPLAPSVLAVAFKGFGASVDVERALNLALFIPLLIVLYRLLVTLSDRFAAAAACAVYVMLFAFGQLTPLRNYNILTPYTNSATYGFSLGIVIAAAMVSYLRDGRHCWLAIAGAACGLSFLTKPEMFLACAVTLIVGWIIAAYVRRESGRYTVRGVCLIVVAFIVAPMLLLIPLAMRSSWGDVWSGTLAGYRMAVDPQVHAMRFYSEGAGFWSFRRSRDAALFWVCAYAWVLAPPLLLALLPGRFRPRQMWLAILGAAALFGVVWYVPNDAHRLDIFKGVPILIALAVCVLIGSVVRARSRGQDALVPAGRLIFTIFAMMMLARMILNAKIYQYGFVLAAAAMMVLVLALLSWVPEALDQSGRCGWIFRGSSLGMLAAFVAVSMASPPAVLRRQSIDLGWGFRSGGMTGEYMKQAITELTGRAKPRDTLATFPSCPWVNFVSGLANPTPYELLDPLGFVRAGGEETVLEAYQKHAPTWVMMVHQDTSEYGGSLFGVHYAQRLNSWIEANYEPVTVWGVVPLKSRAFGISLLRRRADQAAP